MTAQEIFDKVATHLLMQGKRAGGGPGDSCFYRYPYWVDCGPAQNLKCAVGCLIPDELYRPGMEGGNVADLLNTYPEMRAILGDHESLLQDLQSVHDKETVAEWRCALKRLAIRIGLSFSILDELSIVTAAPTGGGK